MLGQIRFEFAQAFVLIPGWKPAVSTTMGILCCFQSHASGGGGGSHHDQAVPSSSAASSSGAFSTDRPVPVRRAGDDRSSRNNNSVDYSNLVALVNEIVEDSVSYRHRRVAEEILKMGKAGKVTARAFTYTELSEATGGFRPESQLGEGGFGPVYRGRLPPRPSGGPEVAVKQLDRNGMQGNREFLVEALMLSLLKHPNLVTLLGFCTDADNRMLVYEYMPLGSLEDHLLNLPPGRAPPDWATRMRVAQGAARGLEYLHDAARPPVIYRDFKASNILLDTGFEARLSDFGLAKVGPVGDKSHVSTRVMGTYGYCAPEYALTGKLTTMSDVYSFGVVFLEMVTGRRAIDTARPPDQHNLVLWAAPRFKDKRRFAELADPMLQGDYPTKGLHQALAIAAMCLQEDATLRPGMSDVVTALDYLTVAGDGGVGDDDEPADLPNDDGQQQKTDDDAPA